MTSHRTYLRAIAMFLSAVAAATSFAACVTNSGPAGNPGTFTLNAAGDVYTYSGNGLQYARCAFGTSGPSCATGTAQVFTWQDALKASVNARDGGFSDWRLPNMQEMAALIEPRCTSPSLSPEFPADPGVTIFWTNTTFASSLDAAWSGNLDNGQVRPIIKTLLRGVRLVRGGTTPGATADTNPALPLTLAASTPTTASGAPFNVVVSTPSAMPAAANVLLVVAGPTGSIGGTTNCTIAASATSCTVTGAQLTGPAGAYTLSGLTTGGGANGARVVTNALVSILPAAAATLTPPASVVQVTPFDVVLTLPAAVASSTTFTLSRVSGPTGTFIAGTTCTVPAGGTTCTFTGALFTGFGPMLELTATPTSGPAIPVTNATVTVKELVVVAPVLPATAIVGQPFNVTYQLNGIASIPLTATGIASGAAGVLSGNGSCTISPLGANNCTVTGLSFSAPGTVTITPILTFAPGSNVEVISVPFSIDIVLPSYAISVVAPTSATVNAPFNVTLQSTLPVAFNVPLTISVASGSGGVLGGGTGCTILAGQTSCVVTGVTYSAVANIQLVGNTTVGGANFSYERGSVNVVAVVLPSYVISAVPPATATVNAPFNVTLQSASPVAFNVPLTISVASGSGGVLGGGTGCTILAGQTSCVVTGVTYSATANIQLVANTTVGGANFSYERGSISIIAAPVVPPVFIAQPVPTLGAGLIALLVLMLGLSAVRLQSRRRG
jgi:hypothetical protein